jgi:hypothetical protein
LSTRLAQGAARDAEREWKQHQGVCARCSRLKSDKSAEPCAAGAPLRNELAALREVARIEAKLDKLPVAGQQSLF